MPADSAVPTPTDGGRASLAVMASATARTSRIVLTALGAAFVLTTALVVGRRQTEDAAEPARAPDDSGGAPEVAPEAVARREAPEAASPDARGEDRKASPLETVLVPPFVVAKRVARGTVLALSEVSALPRSCDGGGCDAGPERPVLLVGYTTSDQRAVVSRIDIEGRTAQVTALPIVFGAADEKLANAPAEGTLRIVERVVPVALVGPDGSNVRAIVDVRENNAQGWTARCGSSDQEPIVRLSGSEDAGAAAVGRCHSHRGLTVWEERFSDDDSGVRAPHLFFSKFRADAAPEVHEVAGVVATRSPYRAFPTHLVGLAGPDALVRGNVVHVQGDPSESFSFASPVTGAAWLDDYLAVSRQGSLDLETLGPETGQPSTRLGRKTVSLRPSFAGCTRRTRTILSSHELGDIRSLLAVRETCDSEERLLLYPATRSYKYSSFEIEDEPVEVKLAHPISAVAFARTDQFLKDALGVLLVYVSRESGEDVLRGLVLRAL